MSENESNGVAIPRELIELVHPDYPTPVADVNQRYEEHAQQVIVTVVNWFDQQVPRHLVAIQLSEDDFGDTLANLASIIHNAQKIHQPWAGTRWGWQRCAGCGHQWPCNTARVLAGNRAVGNSAPAIDRDNKKP